MNHGFMFGFGLVIGSLTAIVGIGLLVLALTLMIEGYRIYAVRRLR